MTEEEMVKQLENYKVVDSYSNYIKTQMLEYYYWLKQ